MGAHIKDTGNSYKIMSSEELVWGIPIENIIDIGCHHGASILSYQKKLNPKKIYGFEGSVENYNILKKNINLPNVELFNMAVSNVDNDNGQFFITKADVCNSLSMPCEKRLGPSTTQTVKVVRIDTWAQQYNVTNLDFVKIDTQGDDFKVILGIGKLIEKVKVLKAEVWFSEPEIYYENVDLFYHVMKYLCENGMRLYQFSNLYHQKNGKLLWGDAVFVKKGLI